MVRGRGQQGTGGMDGPGDIKLGTPLKAAQGGRAVLLLPPSHGRNNLSSRAIPPTCAHGRMEAWQQGGSRELEFGGSISIPALDVARSPGVTQLLGIETLTSETLISSKKVFQGCCGRILCQQVPLPRIGIHLGRGEVSPWPSSPKKQPMVHGDGSKGAPKEIY